MKCNKHSEKDAIAVCVDCGKALCEECRISLAGKNYCQECANKLAVEMQKPTQGVVKREVESEEGLDLVEAILICLFSPIAGLIAWLIWHDKKPKKAEQACIITVIVFVIGLIIYIILLLIGSSGYGY
ncbi:MAG: B-box zinc finger protein [Methanothermobacter sp.]|nr:B-box zinc finger protein [Methanothermobacter sp.]